MNPMGGMYQVPSILVQNNSSLNFFHKAGWYFLMDSLDLRL